MITYDQYESITNLLGDVYELSNDVISELSECSNIITNTQSQRNQIYAVTSIKQGLSRSVQQVLKVRGGVPKSLKQVVQSLQKHILKHYDTVDDFLESGSIMVSSYFSNLSLAVGFLISSNNVRL